MAILSNQLEKRNVDMQIRNLISSRSLAYVWWLREVNIRGLCVQSPSERGSRVQDLIYPYLCDQVKGRYHSTRIKAPPVIIKRIAVYPSYSDLGREDNVKVGHPRPGALQDGNARLHRVHLDNEFL
ncbi:hypothetical protein TNCV_1701941 [Trichonephila clavipes]|nr:hypothetical protein TNCV_1701941 [Trichonephila clavipes]